MNRRRRGSLLLGVALSALFLWLALRGLDLRQVWTYARGGNQFWLLLALLTYFVTVGVRTWRWQYLLRPLTNTRFSSLFGILVLGYFGNNVYPLRIGELIRVYVLQKQEQVPASTGLATLLVERVFDGTAVLLFVFATLPLAPLPGREMRWLVISTSLIFLGALFVFFLLALLPQQATRIVTWCAQHFLPGRWQDRVITTTQSFLQGFSILKRPQYQFWLLLSSLVIWLIETGKYWLVMQAFPFQIPFWGLMLMIGIVNLATILPSAPGFIGTFDLPAIAVLVLFGIDETLATAYVLVLHAVLWLPSAGFGLVYMILAGWRWSDLERAATIGDLRH